MQNPHQIVTHSTVKGVKIDTLKREIGKPKAKQYVKKVEKRSNTISSL